MDRTAMLCTITLTEFQPFNVVFLHYTIEHQGALDPAGRASEPVHIHLGARYKAKQVMIFVKFHAAANALTHAEAKLQRNQSQAIHVKQHFGW